MFAVEHAGEDYIPVARFSHKRKIIFFNLFYLFPKKLPKGEVRDKVRKLIFQKDGEAYIRHLSKDMSMLDFAFLTGVHEYRHYLETDTQDPIADRKGEVVAYYAQDHEYRALGWMIFFAKKHKYSAEAIEHLESLLSKVIDYRREVKQKSNADLTKTSIQ